MMPGRILEVKSFYCKDCKGTFDSDLHLICHQEKFHRIQKNFFKCPHCEAFKNDSRFEVMKHIKKDHQPK